MKYFTELDYDLYFDFAFKNNLTKFDYFIGRDHTSIYEITDGLVSSYSSYFSTLSLSYLTNQGGGYYFFCLDTELLYDKLVKDFNIDSNDKFIFPFLYRDYNLQSISENILSKDFFYYKDIIDSLYIFLKNYDFVRNVKLKLEYSVSEYNSFSLDYNRKSLVCFPILNIDISLFNGDMLVNFCDEVNLDTVDISRYKYTLLYTLKSRLNLKKVKTGKYSILFNPKSVCNLLYINNFFYSFNKNTEFKSNKLLNIKTYNKISCLEPNFNLYDPIYLVKDGVFINDIKTYFFKKFKGDFSYFIDSDYADVLADILIEPSDKAIDLVDGLIVESIDLEHKYLSKFDDKIILACYGYIVKDKVKTPTYFYIVTSYNELFNNLLEIGNDLWEYGFDYNTFNPIFFSSPSILFKDIFVYNSYDFLSSIYY